MSLELPLLFFYIASVFFMPTGMKSIAVTRNLN